MILNVFIEIMGEQRYVGTIDDRRGEATFQYDDSYIKTGLPISVSLPLQREPFSSIQTRNFFEGLLPEGFTRKSVAQHLQIQEDDYLSILRVLGKECLGAIQVLGGDEPEDSIAEAYEKLSLKQVKSLAAEGAGKSAEIVAKSHLSLTGASGKVGLYYNAKNKKWYQPLGMAPSTHIVKQSHVRLKNIVINELLSLETASKLGIPTANSFIVDVGSGNDGEVLFATERYDRSFANVTRTIDGLSCPMRLHQEDFSQALGISAFRKYEPNGEEYLKKCFALIRNVSTNPIEDVQNLLRIMIFDVMIGNTDNHIKNLSLLYSADMNVIRLAPAYDIISTRLYRESSDETSLAIGGTKRIEEIDLNRFTASAREMGLGLKMIQDIFMEMQSGFKDALDESTDELLREGFSVAEHLSADIYKDFKKRIVR